MLESIKQNILLILIWILTSAVLVALALFFGEKASEPKYLTEIDKIFYDNEHQPPKFILTFTDTNEIKKEPVKTETIDVIKEESNEVKIANPSEIVNYIPRLETLKPSQKPAEQKSIPLEYKDAASLKMQPWVYYGRKVEVPSGFYKVTVILKGMGLNETATDLILKSIDNNISIAFAPYARDMKKSISNARKLGFETYIEIPIASNDYLKRDTGPKALNPGASQEEIRQAMSDIIDINVPVGGVVLDGEVVADNVSGITGMLEFIDERGLLLIDATGEEVIESVNIDGLSRSTVDIVVNGAIPKEMLLGFFKRAEDIAREKGYVVIAIDPKPLNIISLTEWLGTFSRPLSYDEIRAGASMDKPFILVPISAVAVE